MTTERIELKNYITGKVNMDKSTLSDIVAKFRYRSLEKDKFLKRKGHFFTDYVFVHSGSIRVYIIDEEGKDITLWVANKGMFFNDVVASRTNKPTDFYMQCLEQTEIAVITNNDMELLYEKHNDWQKFGRLLWEDMTSGLTSRVISLLTTSAEQRYLFYVENTDLLDKIPLNQLSSFLGITPSSLSRIRKGITKRKE